ncbi:transglycosylase domain-containing protein [Cytobacillus purgationiresistens]|uniref:Penicillin-binding protein 2A n=1 Tax=Cytobacillus purgationiresistens TaxID=863449 RepID=A0ABU0ADE1_9BACI|nr:PBP1A family penicillin-binding protein [Cytobacillus purgationiresistens]MDQ0268458.1 penicillin-binding protein 2A [Cytobacillus purgationiresistens]
MKKLQPIWEAIKRFWKKKHITQILLLLLLTVFLLTILFFAFIAVNANVESLQEGLEQSTIIYDKDGDPAASLATNRTEGVSVNALPGHIKNAVIAIEDERFYQHNGFDIKGIGRAFFNNIFAGRITGGGSTVTQQLAKNALLTTEQTYRRKIEELFLAVEIEKKYEKDDILQMYLNQVYFGSGAWGIESAANKYFSKTVSQLTISESAMLAGLLQSPSYLDPYKNYEGAMKRRDTVLGKMNEHKMITEEEYQAAKNEKLQLKEGVASSFERKYPYYVDAVLDEAINQYGLTQEEIFTRGYKIYTEMDQNIQSSLENVYARDSLFPAGKGGALVQSGAVLLDPNNGGVRGLVGGRGDHVFRGFNRATHIKAQPGSTLKPLAVYTPALEEGYKPTSILKDEPTSYGDYHPENSTKQYSGDVEMYKAVEESLNVPAVWLLNEIGLKKGLDSLERFGIPLEKEDEYLGIGLGGMRTGISPLTLAEAYSTFPNEGKRNDGHLITKIVGPTGKTIAERKKTTVKVTSKSVSKDMSAMLLNVMETGTGSGAKINGVQLAGKTGSTQLPYNDVSGTKDQWLVGYTSNIVGAVWLGYDQTDREHYLSSSTSDNVVPVFKAVMESTLPYVEDSGLSTKSVNETINNDQRREQVGEAIKEQTDKIEGKIKEELPKWKETIKEGMNEAKDFGRFLKEKWNNFTN